MLGRKTHSADAVHGGVPSDFDTNQLTAGEQRLCFYVEEDDMLVDLEVRAAYSGAAAGVLDVTLYLGSDGAALANIGGTNGYYRMPLGASNAISSLYFSETVSLSKGYHIVEVRVSSATTPTLEADATTGFPCSLVARRHSHPGTLGHGVDSKVQLAQ